MSKDKAATALVDASHGQCRWSQTGFPSRELHSNFAGVTEELCRLGFKCRTTSGFSFSNLLPVGRLLAIPSPAGRYNPRKQRWESDGSTLFTSGDIESVLEFLRVGGRLLGFGYRFGDSFTQSNLNDLLEPIGCHLNDDAVMDARILKTTHPLDLYFDTTDDVIACPWARTGIKSVRWRPVATISIQARTSVWPLVLSPGGQYLSFNPKLQIIDFSSLPLAVVGLYGKGRFALFGGPHLFETGPLGFLETADNRRLLQNVISWLVSEQPIDCSSSINFTGAAASISPEFTAVQAIGEGARTFAAVERILRRRGVLKALNRAKWMP